MQLYGGIDVALRNTELQHEFWISMTVDVI